MHIRFTCSAIESNAIVLKPSPSDPWYAHSDAGAVCIPLIYDEAKVNTVLIPASNLPLMTPEKRDDFSIASVAEEGSPRVDTSRLFAWAFVTTIVEKG